MKPFLKKTAAPTSEHYSVHLASNFHLSEGIRLVLEGAQK